MTRVLLIGHGLKYTCTDMAESRQSVVAEIVEELAAPLEVCQEPRAKGWIDAAR